MTARKSDRRDSSLQYPSGDLSATEKELSTWVKCRRVSQRRMRVYRPGGAD